MIKTARCELNTLKDSEHDFVMRLYTDAKVRCYLGGVVELPKAGFKSEMLKPNSEKHYWVIRAKNSNSLSEIGIVSLTPHHNNIDTEVSYQLLP